MKEKKISPMGLLLRWGLAKTESGIIGSVLCGFISGILGIGAYIGIYRLMDALGEWGAVMVRLSWTMPY